MDGTPPAHQRKPPRVLLVEDSPELLEALEMVLEEAGYDVTSVSSAEEGLRALRATGFDLVVSDYSLPNHTGAWMLGQAVLAGALDRRRAVIVTAEPRPLSDGFRVIRKPVDVDDFLGQLSAMLP